MIGLRDAAIMMDITTITQREINDLEDYQRQYTTGAMIHCAAGDSEVTLRIFLAVLVERIGQLERKDGVRRVIREEYCFLALDL